MYFKDMEMDLRTYLRNILHFLFFPISSCTYVFKGFSSPFHIADCETQKVPSLLQCTNLCRQNAGVTFFYNPSTMSCRWKCLTVNAKGNLTDGWKRYGEYNVFHKD
jgi:hypothetical protein